MMYLSTENAFLFHLQFLERIADQYVANLKRFVAGEPLHSLYDWNRGY